MAVFSIPWCPQYACTCARMVAPGHARRAQWLLDGCAFAPR